MVYLQPRRLSLFYRPDSRRAANFLSRFLYILSVPYSLPLVDDGTAWEIGYFYSIRSNDQPIFGIRTDFRNAGDVPGAQVNLMIDCSCDCIFSSVEGLLKQLKEAF